MSSPTGYVAVVNVYAWRLSDGKLDYAVLDDERRPVLHWNEDGHPVVSDEGGDLMTVVQYVDLWVADPDPSDTEHKFTGSFEIHGE